MESHAFAQPTTGIRSDEPGLLATSGNDRLFQRKLPASPDNPASGYVRAPVVPESQASPRGVGTFPMSPGSEPLDQDSTVILSGVEPPSPRRWKCDPHAETLPMSDNWYDDLITSHGIVRPMNALQICRR